MTKSDPLETTLSEMRGVVFASLARVETKLEKGDEWPLVRNEDGPDQLYIFGSIVPEYTRLLFEDCWPDDVSGSQITKLLNDYDGTELEVVINCPGGLVSQGAVIYESLMAQKNAGTKLTAFIAGQAASAATYVMLAADEIEIGAMGEVFVHPPQFSPIGPVTAMKAEGMAKDLKEIEANYIALVKAERGVDLSSAIHENSASGEGTLYNAKAAVKVGLVDSVRGAEDKAEPKQEATNEEAPKQELKSEALEPDKLQASGKEVPDHTLETAKDPEQTEDSGNPVREGLLDAETLARRDAEVALGLWPKNHKGD